MGPTQTGIQLLRYRFLTFTPGEFCLPSHIPYYTYMRFWILLALAFASCGDEIVVEKVNSVSWDPNVCGREFGNCYKELTPAMNKWDLHREMLLCEYDWRACMLADESPQEPDCSDILYSCLGEAAFVLDELLRFVAAGECFSGRELCEDQKSASQTQEETPPGP